MTTSQTFTQITREQGAMIGRIASSYEARPHLAEELVQDIYFALWRALPSYRGDASLRTFVARIAINRAITHVTRALKSPPSCELTEHIPMPGNDPEAEVMAMDRSTRLLAAVRRLPLAYRQTALLALEGLAPKEIADALGITTNTVSVRMSRAKDLLRELIGDKP